ncbi:TerB family tellurite resistance protein [Paenibacillus sp. NPDC058174]|uniref:tellurite resistance TerB family protein n=1 Tax=Paenibacillus sp. NPDC058174 TaxID=3346366 RepID=UPI0036DEE41C
MEHKIAFLDLANRVAKADGCINTKEKDYIRLFMNEMNISEADYQCQDHRDIKDIIGNLQDEQVKRIFFAEILLLVFADGDYNDDEKQLARKLQELFGLSEETYEAFKDWVVRMDQLKLEGLKIILA